MTYGPNAEFFDADGVPVVLDYDAAPVCTAHDTDPPRPYDPGRLAYNGYPVTRDQFDELLGRLRAVEKERAPPTTDGGWFPPNHPVLVGSKPRVDPVRRCIVVTRSGHRCRNACAPGGALCATHRALEQKKQRA